MNENTNLRAEIEKLKERVRRLEQARSDAVLLSEISDKIDANASLLSAIAEAWEIEPPDDREDESSEPSIEPPTPWPRPKLTRLDVTMPDGTNIKERIAAETLVKTIARLGIERVKKLDVWTMGYPLISHRSSGRPAVQHRECDQHFIITHSSTAHKKRLLDEIAHGLGESLQVKVIPR